MNRKDTRNKKLIGLVGFFILFCLLFYPSQNAYCGVRATGLVITINPPNPFGCPGGTTVQVNLSYVVTNEEQRPKTGWIRLYDEDFLFDDLLDLGFVTVDPINDPSPGVKTIIFDIWCTDCCAGGITGPHGNSGECTAEIYAYAEAGVFGGLSSNVCEARCDHDCSVGTIPDEAGSVGENAVSQFDLLDTLELVQIAGFHILYDSALLSIVDAEIVNPILAPYQSVDYSVPGIISFYSEIPTPSDIHPGTLATFTVHVSEDASYQKTQFEFDPNSVFVNYQGDALAFDWDIGNFVILPADSMPPYINEAQIVYNPISITGMSGAITDDYDSLQNYLRVKFYDDEISYWLVFDVNSEGGFVGEEIWLRPSSVIDLIAFDGVGNADTVEIIMQSHFGDVTTISDTMGTAGSTVPVNFYLLNWSYFTQNYNLQVTDSEGWNLSPPPPSIVLDSMQDTTMTINVTIPPGELQGTINWIKMTSTSQADPLITDSDSLFVEVVVSCDYTPGDANGDGNIMGNDVTYSVRYFKGLGAPPPDSCEYQGGWLYSAGDANGNCSYAGSDVTFLVAYFKGINPEVLWCPDTPPAEPPVLGTHRDATPVVLPRR